MNFLVITHVLHKRHNGRLYAYGPYVREMNLWFKNTDKVRVVAPVTDREPSALDMPYEKDVDLHAVPAFSLTSPAEMIKTLAVLPFISLKIIRGMRWADHIHLRLPGNMGLLGSFWQIFFPEKPKTAKYAGNWDPNSAQPWSYRLQKKIVASPFWSRNMKVLVYGRWPGQSDLTVPFFTASYSENEIIEIPDKSLQAPYRFVFAGSLSEGKRPLLALEAFHRLLQKGYDGHMDFYGDGPERVKLEKYISDHRLGDKVKLHGKQSAGTLREAYVRAHFLLFPSRSEGWPKVVMEAMTWKCLPVCTPVSAVPEMLGHGERGSLVPPDAGEIAREVEKYFQNPELYRDKTRKGFLWARGYTLERFERAIKEILHG